MQARQTSWWWGHDVLIRPTLLCLFWLPSHCGRLVCVMRWLCFFPHLRDHAVLGKNLFVCVLKICSSVYGCICFWRTSGSLCCVCAKCWMLQLCVIRGNTSSYFQCVCATPQLQMTVWLCVCGFHTKLKSSGWNTRTYPCVMVFLFSYSKSWPLLL